MRILYGVMGEGLGHAMRARVVIAGLQAQGHIVLATASARASALLRGDGVAVVDVDGSHLVARNGRVLRLRTLGENLAEAPARLRQAAGIPWQTVQAFAPDVVVSDFASFAHAAGKALGVPVISLDHQHILSVCRHHAVLPSPLAGHHTSSGPPGAGAVRLARTFVTAKLPGCAHHIVPSFFFPPVKRRLRTSTTVVGPILRQEWLQAQTEQQSHVVVYQSAGGDPALLEALRNVDAVEFRVYGLGIPAGAAAGAGAGAANVVFCSFSERGFLDDMRTARAVLVNGGFTAIAEALVLGKPVLSVPLRHQGEQVLNALWLQELGFGRRLERWSEEGVVRFFDDVHAGRFRRADDDEQARWRSGTADTLRALDECFARLAQTKAA